MLVPGPRTHLPASIQTHCQSIRDARSQLHLLHQIQVITRSAQGGTGLRPPQVDGTWIQISVATVPWSSLDAPGAALNHNTIQPGGPSPGDIAMSIQPTRPSKLPPTTQVHPRHPTGRSYGVELEAYCQSHHASEYAPSPSVAMVLNMVHIASRTLPYTANHFRT